MKKDRVLEGFTYGIAEFIDNLFTDDKDEKPTDKNPYTASQIKFAIERYLGFCAAKRIIQSFEYKNIVSTPDRLEISFIFTYQDKPLSFDVYTKF